MHLEVNVYEPMAGLQWPVPVDTLKWVLKKDLQYEPKSEKILFPVIYFLD